MTALPAAAPAPAPKASAVSPETAGSNTPAVGGKSFEQHLPGQKMPLKAAARKGSEELVKKTEPTAEETATSPATEGTDTTGEITSGMVKGQDGADDETDSGQPKKEEEADEITVASCLALMQTPAPNVAPKYGIGVANAGSSAADGAEGSGLESAEATALPGGGAPTVGGEQNVSGAATPNVIEPAKIAGQQDASTVPVQVPGDSATATLPDTAKGNTPLETGTANGVVTQPAAGTATAKSPDIMVSAYPTAKAAKAIKPSRPAPSPAAPVVRAETAAPLLARGFGLTSPLREQPVAATLAVGERNARSQQAPAEPAVVTPADATTAFTFREPTLTPTSPAAPMAAVTATAPAVETVMHELNEATAKIQSSGADKMEVQVRLHTGEEVTIKLQLTDGRVAATVRTDSDSLRQALEQHWSSHAPAAADRANGVTTPVFESARSQAGQPDFSSRGQQQQRRDEQAEGREQFGDSTPWPRPGKNPMPSRSAQTAAPASSVQLYA